MVDKAYSRWSLVQPLNRVIKEAWGFEEGSPIWAHLKSKGWQCVSYRHGKAPPLACLLRGPRADQIRAVLEKAEAISSVKPDPTQAAQIVVLESGIIPWGGLGDFYKSNQAKATKDHQDSSAINKDFDDDMSDGSDEQPDEPGDEEVPKDWTLTYQVVRTRYREVNLRNDDEERPLPIGR